MGLMLCKNTALVVVEFAYFSYNSHLFQPSIYFSLSSLLPLFRLVFFCHLFLRLFSSVYILYLFLLLSSFFPLRPRPTLTASSPLSCSLSSPSFLYSLWLFRKPRESSTDWISQGNVPLDCQVSFLKIKPVMVQPAPPRCSVNFKAVGFSIASASLRQDPLF